MTPGSLLRVLDNYWYELPELLDEHSSVWRTLDVDYEPPRVERLWRQLGPYRLMLHRIHPCEKALFHPHPWPSAVRVVSGRYEMGVSQGHVLLNEHQPEVARLILTAGSQYEMVHPLAWHYVRPLDEPSLSVMVTGKPWDPPVFDHAKFGGSVEHAQLTNDAKQGLIAAFRRVLR